MEENQFRIILQLLKHICTEFRRMANAAEEQVKETKAMREMVERQREGRQ